MSWLCILWQRLPLLVGEPMGRDSLLPLDIQRLPRKCDVYHQRVSHQLLELRPEYPSTMKETCV